MSQPRIVLFDSGMGGLTVARAVAAQMPHAHLIYSADNAGFPYGPWKEKLLVERIRKVMAELIERTKPDVVVIACNTATTIAIADLRARFDVPFVGTVPAIKPAAALTKSGIIGVLATPGTVNRDYTHQLTDKFALLCKVFLHGAPKLAEMAENKLRGGKVNLGELADEILPVFRKRDGGRTDVVVLGCTHYPLLIDEMREVAPWDVTYLDPSAAIARHVEDVVKKLILKGEDESVPPLGSLLLTGPKSDPASLRAYASLGFDKPHIIDLPV